MERNGHDVVVERLKGLRRVLSAIETLRDNPALPKGSAQKLSDSKAVSFSDSIIIFSRDGSKESLSKILVDSSILTFHALKLGVPIKGAIAFGQVTADFETSLFFGRPIIDSYMLHDQIQLYAVVLDCSAESQLQKLTDDDEFKTTFVALHKTPLKTGRVIHYLVRPPKSNLAAQIDSVHTIYSSVSGTPRLYVDNTLDFLNSLKS